MAYDIRHVDGHPGHREQERGLGIAWGIVGDCRGAGGLRVWVQIIG
jgi:hypothetical protein